jgi:hypothetical protein
MFIAPGLQAAATPGPRNRASGIVSHFGADFTVRQNRFYERIVVESGVTTSGFAHEVGRGLQQGAVTGNLPDG